ncbi:uncharacterized protein At3g61260-like [Impatiens glandulifera]|uniref:uncharacterized protein At3g61260-like n=1 Tax=Impatiens glandulifera TaxID=253017 RepID=UPI001FB0F97D|nr:uncharacterized protein At3g61260-like [Impatiens glandulifera]
MTTAEEKTGESPVPAPENTVAVAVEEKAVKEQKTPDSSVEKTPLDRDIALSQVENEKRLSFIKAWEETEKSKVQNKAENQLSTVTTWENTKKAKIEAQLKKLEEELEKKKADYAEKMKNKVALVHKEAEERRASVEANRAQDVLKAEELAAKYRATGLTPKSGFGCLGA